MSSITTAIPTGTWAANPVHSKVGFALKYVVSTYRGDFQDFDATLTSADGDVKLVGTVRPGSISVKDENLAAHLQSPDFFDSERYPELRFESTSFTVDGDDLVVEGDLTIKGNTQHVVGRGTLNGPSEDFAGNTRLGIELEAEIDRTAFGVSWNAPLPKGGLALANEVALQVELEFILATA
jgi:polyisoprenoid-binding protein YceI